MVLPNAINFSDNIRKHAIIVGVLFTLDTIGTFVLFATWDRIPVPPEHSESFKNIQNVLLYTGGVSLLFTIIYWIGFLKRVRLCITVCLVFVVLSIVLQVIGLLGAMIELSIVNTIIMLIVLGINGYVWLVLVQLRRIMLNGFITDSGQV
uniref:Uncharacterized protein n=1 Tax=Anopheles atroparvus TaxID=41427 RepID=A0AAG5D647_ANOAO